MLQQIKKYGKGTGLLLVAFGLILRCSDAKAQTAIASTVTGTYTNGIYYNNSSITFNPNTDLNPGTGQSLEFYIGGCASLNTSFGNNNRIVTTIPRKNTYEPGMPYGTAPDGSYTNCDVMQTIQYYDGLGRLSQTVQQKASPQGNDIVQPMAYDAFGREVKKYLPYVLTSTPGNGVYRAAAIEEQTAFYNAPASEGVTPILNSAFAETVFEPSPLNRVTEQGAPGAPWQIGSGHTIGITYSTNTSADPIKRWIIYAGGTNDGGTYPANSLYVTTTVDENNHATVEFKDKDGRVVCKKIQKDSGYTYTYYIYDDFGNLAYVIPPLPTGVSLPASFSESSSTEFNLYMYGYHYDDRNRIVQKKIPGKGWEYMVYNKLDQVVATQDGVQRGKSPQEWTFMVYDGLGRLTQSGVYQSSSGASLYDIQLAVNTTVAQFDTYTGAGTYGYNNAAWPNNSSVATYLTVNYYGRYDFPGKPSAYNTTLSGTMTSPDGLTGSLTKILPETGAYTGGMLWSVAYYDAKGRAVQSFSQHYKGGAGSFNVNNYDRIDNTYNDFTSELTSSIRYHYVGGSNTLQLTTAYTYDHMGRKLKTTSKVGTNAEVTLSNLSYNETGQLKGKKLHGNSSDSFLQGISYTYNERGWLRSTTSPLFAMQLNYNEEGANMFNGNISKQYWGTPGNLNKNYVYAYDAMNRLTSGTASTGNNETIGYDDLGNIKTLTRTGAAPAVLTYPTYDGNQLKLVKNNNVDFRTYGTYDANGNAPSDGQGHNISYNILNLPRSVLGLNMSYVYDAAGRKLQKVFSGVTTDYVNGIEYENGALQFVQNEEGRILSLTGTPNYEYSLKDHLGNARVTFDNSGGAVAKQTDDYYPFGLVAYQPSTPSPENKYLYNGKELQEGIKQYDYGARFYDPVVARWTTVDPLSEKYDAWAPYSYVKNNPIKFIDPDGREITNGAKQGTPEYEKTETALKILSKTNPEAYSTLKQSKTNYIINYGSLNPGAGDDGNGTTTFNTTTHYGRTNISAGGAQGLAVGETQRDNEGNIVGGTLVRNLNGEEQEAMRDAGQDPSGKKKTIGVEEADGLVRFGPTATITLDESLLGDQKKLTIALGHEFGHAQFAELKKALYFLWRTIDPGTGGHGKNNPNGKKAKEEEDKTRANYDANKND